MNQCNCFVFELAASFTSFFRRSTKVNCRVQIRTENNVAPKHCLSLIITTVPHASYSISEPHELGTQLIFRKIYLSRLLGQHELWPGDVGIGARGRNPPELHRLIARAARQQAVVERREGKVRHGVRMAVDPGDGGLVGAAAGRQRQDGKAGAQGVPVEGHVRGTGRDVVAA
jgi:hypothetical protein